MTNPWAMLFRSRKFWVSVLDLVVSLILYFAGKYAGPSPFEDIQYVVLAIQPVFLMLIAMIAAEDISRMDNLTRLSDLERPSKKPTTPTGK